MLLTVLAANSPASVSTRGRLLNGLAATDFAEEWDWFYRSQRYLRARRLPKPANVTRRFLADSWGNRCARIFPRPESAAAAAAFRKQVATFHDLFVLTGDYSTPDFASASPVRQRSGGRSGSDHRRFRLHRPQVETYLQVPASRIRVIHHGVVAARDSGPAARENRSVRGRDSAAQESGDAGPGVSRNAGGLDAGSGGIAGI